jgi:hypothetical protein
LEMPKKEKRPKRFRPDNGSSKVLESMFATSAQWEEQQIEELAKKLSAKKQRVSESYIKKWLQRRRQKEVITIFLQGHSKEND